MRKITWKLMATLVLLGVSQLSLAQNYKDIVVFGDSLSDSGNAFVLTGELSKPPYQLIPDAAYARGGKHFSNGKTWVEQLAKRMKISENARPALKEEDSFQNYAVGGARARAGNASFHLSNQVGLYLSDVGGQASAETLYVIFIGGNDVRDAIENPAFAGTILTAALTAVQDNIVALTSAGARNFLIANAPDLSLVPALNKLPAPFRHGISTLSVQYNLGLQATVAGLVGAFGITVTDFDVFGLIKNVTLDAEGFGFNNVLDSCINVDAINKPACAKPGDYLFWDGIHPTEAGHAELAQEAAQALGLE